MSVKVVENYSLLEVIGSGQYGKVYKAVNIKNNSLVAVKVVKIEKFKEVPKLEEFTMNEIQTLARINNPHVVKFIEMQRVLVITILYMNVVIALLLKLLFKNKEFKQKKKLYIILDNQFKPFNHQSKKILCIEI